MVKQTNHKKKKNGLLLLPTQCWTENVTATQKFITGWNPLGKELLTVIFIFTFSAFLFSFILLKNMVFSRSLSLVSVAHVAWPQEYFLVCLWQTCNWKWQQLNSFFFPSVSIFPVCLMCSCRLLNSCRGTTNPYCQSYFAEFQFVRGWVSKQHWGPFTPRRRRTSDTSIASGSCLHIGLLVVFAVTHRAHKANRFCGLEHF